MYIKLIMCVMSGGINFHAMAQRGVCLLETLTRHEFSDFLSLNIVIRYGSAQQVEILRSLRCVLKSNLHSNSIVTMYYMQLPGVAHSMHDANSCFDPKQRG